MAAHDPVILGVGMMTAVGLTAAETAASVRAGVAGFAGTDWIDQYGERITAAQVPTEGLPELQESVAESPDTTEQIARLLLLGALPIKEALKPLGNFKKSPGLVLALPDAELFDAGIAPQTFLKLFAEQVNGLFDPARSSCVSTGRAGGLLAIDQACQIIRQGRDPFMIAGGIDSFVHFFLLGILDSEQRLASARHLDGFIPGEGAAFLLLGSAQAARNAGLQPLAAIIDRAAEANEEGHRYSESPYRGEGLAQAMSQFFAQRVSAGPITDVFSSMNGEHYWAKEWGVAFMRNKSAFLEEHAFHHPADCFGDTGAACGVLCAGLATLGIKQGRARGPALAYASSDGPRRVVLAISPCSGN